MRTSKLMLFIGTCSTLGLTGCMHLKEVGYANQEVPAYFTARDFISDQQMAPLGGDIQWFAGRLGYKRDDGKFVFTTKLVVGAPDIKIATLQKSPDYHSVLTMGFAGNATLPMLNADASGDTARDYEITDIANVIVPDAAMPTRAAAAAAVPTLPAGKSLWWVNVVGLSAIRYSIASNSKGSSDLAGAAFNAKGTVYDNASTGIYIPLACVLVQPMNAAADAELAVAPKPQTPPIQPPEALVKALSAMIKESSTLIEAPQIPESKQQKTPDSVAWRPVLTQGKGLLSWTAEK